MGFKHDWGGLMRLTIDTKIEKLEEYCSRFSECMHGGCPFYNKDGVLCDFPKGVLKEYEVDEALEVFESYFNPKPKEMVNHPSHYNREGAMETIDEMEVLFGTNATFEFCRLNAWKYRARANAKNGQEDMEKSDWYIRKAAELKTKLRMDGAYDHRTEGI